MTRLSAGLIASGFCVALFLQAGGMPVSEAEEKTKSKTSKLLRHVVLFKFKESASKKQVQQVVDEFKALPGKIDAIHDFEMGTDVSVEKKAQGFTHCFLVTFRSEKGRDEYLPHPAHKAFGKIVRPVLDDVLVFDYWAER